MATIGDLITGTGSIIGLRYILNNRTDVVNTSELYQSLIAAAILEVTESYPFDELRVTGPDFVLTPNTYLYPLSSWLASGDTNATQLLSFSLVLPATNSSSAIIPLDYKNPKELEPMLWVSAPCKNWTRFGSNILLGPMPDQAYTTYLRYQKKHPLNTSPLYNQVVYAPDSWLEIITYSAGIRAGIILREASLITQCHDVLYGDPEYINSQGKRGRPGIIASRVFNQERDASKNAGTMQPVIDTYTLG